MQVRELESRGLADKGERVKAELLDQLLEPPACFATLSAVEQRTLRDLLRKLVDANSNRTRTSQEQMPDAG
jgi:hypothetical protein